MDTVADCGPEFDSRAMHLRSNAQPVGASATAALPDRAGPVSAEATLRVMRSTNGATVGDSAASAPKAAHLVRGEQARQRILSAAADAFAREGFNGSSLERIARAAGLTKPGVLHHFGSKRELLGAVLDARTDEALLKAGRDRTSLNVLDTLLIVARRDVADDTRTRCFAVLLGEAVAHDSPVADWFRDHHAQLTEEIGAAIRAAGSGGSARTDIDPDALAAEAVAVMDGLQIQWLLGGDAEDYLARLEGYLTRLRAHLTLDTA